MTGSLAQMSKRAGYPIVAVIFVFLLTTKASAQTGSTTSVAITVSDELAIDSGDSLSLDVYFAVHNAAGRAIPQAQVQSATILLEDGSQIPAQVEKPPYYIALVLDASGSMRDVFDQVQAAAIQAIEAAPEEVYFAVIRFDENIDLVQPFTNSRDQAIDAVNQIEINDSGTCLYDVAYTAVEALEQIARNAPRRAMLLFTDGRDEKRQGDADSCSRNTYDQLVSFASERSVPTPIHTVGLAGNQRRIKADDLRDLSRATGGLSAIGDGDILARLFQEIMDDVDSQWLARAELYPNRGLFRGSLFVNLADGSLPLAAPISFVSGKNYELPPKPVTIAVDNFTYNETADLYFFDVALTNAENVGSLEMEILDSEDNVQVDRDIFTNPAAVQQLMFSGDELDAGRLYVAVISPRNLNGNPVKNDDGQPLLATYPFRYDPPRELVFSIDSVQIKDEEPILDLRRMKIEDDEAELIVNLHAENAAAASTVGRLVRQQDNLQVDQFTFDAPSGEFRLPLRQEAGQYTLFVDLLAEEGRRLASDRLTFSYAPPIHPIARAAQAVQANPFISLVTLILVVLMGLFGLWLGSLWGRRRVKAAARRRANEEGFPEPAVEVAQAETAFPPVRLRVLTSPDQSLANGDGRAIDHLPYTIGREGCDLTIVGDRHISRRHAIITFEDGVFYIEDAGSSNGTFVNDARIPAHDPTPLSADIGARIRVGKTTTLTFSELRSATAPARPSPEETIVQ